MYQLPVTLTTSYVGPDRHLTLPCLFRIFQDAAIEDSEKIGYGHEATLDRGLLWVFSRVYVRIHSLPAYLSKTSFKTVSGPKKAFLFPRFGTLYDEDGSIAAEFSSIWALVHEDTRRVEMRPVWFESLDQTDGTEIPLPEKATPVPALFRSEHVVQHSEIDLNGHMNNIRYIELLVNLHDSAFYQKNQIKELTIQYESEIHEGEKIELYVDAKTTYVRGVVGDRIAFEANLVYAPLD